VRAGSGSDDSVAAGPGRGEQAVLPPAREPLPPSDPTLGVPTQADPTVAAASATAWRGWLAQLLTAGRTRLAGFGLALLLGFGAGVVTLYLFAVLADVVVAGDTERLDFAVLLWLRERQSPALDAVAWICSLLGSELLAVFLILLLMLLGVRRRWGASAALLLVTVGAQLENNVLKDLFQRTRPAPVTGLIPAQAFSFPSGHAMVAAAFYAFLGYLAWRLLRGWLRVACVGTLALLVLLIGLSRLYLGVHYVTDVVAGYLAGLFWANAVIVGGALLTRRRHRAGLSPASEPVPVDLAAAPLPVGGTAPNTPEPRTPSAQLTAPSTPVQPPRATASGLSAATESGPEGTAIERLGAAPRPEEHTPSAPINSRRY